MKTLLRISAIFAATLALAVSAANEDAVSKAKDAAQGWLALADTGDGARTWQAGAANFQAVVTQEQWTRALTAVRTPLGAVKGRTLKEATFTKTLPGAPDGEYVVIQYATAFENKPSSIETITSMKEKDGSWKVAGYFIK